MLLMWPTVRWLLLRLVCSKLVVERAELLGGEAGLRPGDHLRLFVEVARAFGGDVVGGAIRGYAGGAGVGGNLKVGGLVGGLDQVL